MSIQPLTEIDEEPNVFGRVEFRAVWRQGPDHHVFRDVEGAGTVAGGTVVDHEDELALVPLDDFLQEHVHRGGGHDGQDQEVGGAAAWTDGAVGVGVFPDDLFADRGPRPFRRPTSLGIIDASEAGFVLEHHPQWQLPGVRRHLGFGYDVPEVFLKEAAASGSHFG